MSNGKVTYRKSGRDFKIDEINLIQKIVKEKYHTNRCEISRRICRELDWHSENGKPKAWVCRELLIELERDGIIKLPEPQKRSFNRFKKKELRFEFIPPQNKFEGSLGDFPRPELFKVTNSKDNTFWEYLVEKYHYLGYKGVMGRFLKYIVYIWDIPVACLGWTGAALRVRARDNCIGWSEEQRERNLKHLVNNFRFVIFPWAKIKYLASHLLSRSIAIVKRDWKEQYNVEVYLFETFVDKSRFSGISYKASNWRYVGETKGYAKRKSGYEEHGLKKDVYLYPVKLNLLNRIKEKREL